MMDAIHDDRIPPEMQELAGKLLRDGFTLERSYFSGGFGNYLLKLRKGDLYVELDSDRSVESVSVGLSEWSPSLLVDIWHACIRGTALLLSPPDLAGQIALLIDDLRLIEDRVRDDPASISACVKERHEGRAYERFGLSSEWET